MTMDGMGEDQPAGKVDGSSTIQNTTQSPVKRWALSTVLTLFLIVFGVMLWRLRDLKLTIRDYEEVIAEQYKQASAFGYELDITNATNDFMWPAATECGATNGAKCQVWYYYASCKDEVGHVFAVEQVLNEGWLCSWNPRAAGRRLDDSGGLPI